MAAAAIPTVDAVVCVTASLILAYVPHWFVSMAMPDALLLSPNPSTPLNLGCFAASTRYAQRATTRGLSCYDRPRTVTSDPIDAAL